MEKFEQYLRDNIDAVDFRIRARVDIHGKVRFYIHPATRGGETVNFVILNGHLIPTTQT